jgi:tRNA G18 (ribose-2'-O)-methylase SpoU
VRERCDETVRIPMRGLQASINAAVAAAIVMAEAARQMDEGRPGPTMS